MTSGEEDEVTIHVRYKDVVKTFSGSVNGVWVSINQFFNEFIPTFELSRKLVLNIDLQELLKEFQNIVAFSSEGPCMMISKDRLTDNETLTLQLLVSHVGNRLGLMKDDSVTKEELQTKLGKSSKITSTRLGELVKREMATRTPDGKYKITAFGTVKMQNDILPRIRSRTGV